VNGTPYVRRIAYNAHGQRLLVALGNDVMARYAYHPKTFRLARLRTQPCERPVELTFRPSGRLLQDIAYEYDLTGNLLSTTDRTPGCGVRNNLDALLYPELGPQLASGDALIRHFTHDPLYRLRSATGRERATRPAVAPWEEVRDAGFDSAAHGTPTQDNAPDHTRLYVERYRYDPADNLVGLEHSNGSSWSRSFGVGGLDPVQWSQAWPPHVGVHLAPGDAWANPPSNRLTHAADGPPAAAASHAFDANGRLVQEETSRFFEWTAADRLRVFREQTSGAEPTRYVHYLHDALGRCVKKVVRKRNAPVEVTVYIDGLYEHHLTLDVTPAGLIESASRNSLHIFDGSRRIATLLAGEPFPGVPDVPVQYHLEDHLGSSVIVAGGQDAGSRAFINREEYLPFGATAFGSYGRKRYRFLGRERDEESGLVYCEARWYAPWLLRWITPDPARGSDGVNAYVYCRNNPLTLVDPAGRQSKQAARPGTNVGSNPSPQKGSEEEGLFERLIKRWLFGEPREEPTPAAPIAAATPEPEPEWPAPPLLEAAVSPMTHRGFVWNMQLYDRKAFESDPDPDKFWRVWVYETTPSPKEGAYYSGSDIGHWVFRKGLWEQTEPPAPREALPPPTEPLSAEEQRLRDALLVGAGLLAGLAVIGLVANLLAPGGFARNAGVGIAMGLLSVAAGVVWLLYVQPWKTATEKQRDEEEAERAEAERKYKQLKDWQSTFKRILK
jgi:RHS repeat-associated protein